MEDLEYKKNFLILNIRLLKYRQRVEESLINMNDNMSRLNKQNLINKIQIRINNHQNKLDYIYKDLLIMNEK